MIEIINVRPIKEIGSFLFYILCNAEYGRNINKKVKGCKNYIKRGMKND